MNFDDIADKNIGLFIYTVKDTERKEVIKRLVKCGTLRLPLTVQCVECEDGKLFTWLSDIPLETTTCKCGKTVFVYWNETVLEELIDTLSINSKGNDYLC